MLKVPLADNGHKDYLCEKKKSLKVFPYESYFVSNIYTLLVCINMNMKSITTKYLQDYLLSGSLGRLYKLGRRGINGY